MKKHNWKYMDIHTHILPGVDDGAADMDETMKMVEMADKEGVTVIIATPHFGLRNPDYDSRYVNQVYTTVKEWMRSTYPHMKIYMGNEIYYSKGCLDAVKSGQAARIGGTDYVLLEFSVKDEFEHIAGAVREFTREGFRPILAHIERYECLYKDIDAVHELAELGAYMQVNTRGFLGGRFDKRAAWCRKLLQEGLIHFVASDCHNTGSRTPLMKTAVAEMIDASDYETVKRVVNTNIIRLIKNEYI